MTPSQEQILVRAASENKMKGTKPALAVQMLQRTEKSDCIGGTLGEL